MSKNKEISATAKLLEIIRNDAESAEPATIEQNQGGGNSLSDLHLETSEAPTAKPGATIDTAQGNDEPILTLELEESPPQDPHSSSITGTCIAITYLRRECCECCRCSTTS